METIWSLFITILVLAVVVWFAFLPAKIAFKRKHKDSAAIFVCTIVGFFTGIFWIVALIWSLTDNTQK